MVPGPVNNLTAAFVVQALQNVGFNDPKCGDLTLANTGLKGVAQIGPIPRHPRATWRIAGSGIGIGPRMLRGGLIALFPKVSAATVWRASTAV